MKINPEAQLAVKLYERMFQKRRAEGVAVHVITGAITTDSFTVCRDAAKLCSLARAIHRIDETYCNRTLTNREV
ncbi:MAG: hypothetical protein KGI27_15790, partial [Thaumarchaeota archaeon]|nr:hypothetical protein [Nitrososphaerota archaeon]